jgi:hypothetical protein
LLRLGLIQNVVHGAYVIDRLIRIKRVDRRYNGAGQGIRFVNAPDDKRHTILRALPVGPVYLRARIGIEAVVADVAHDPDDFQPRLSGKRDSESFPGDPGMQSRASARVRIF